MPEKTTAIATVSDEGERMELVRRTIAKGCTNDELALFMATARRIGLDPFARQIYAVRRKEWDHDAGGYVEKMSIQVSIDGYRVIAERTGKYHGQIGPLWCGADGEWKDVWLSDKPPAAAKVGIIRSDFTDTLWGVARFEAYAQRKKDGKLMGMWARMPDVMLAKCAESIALRRAFPNELSGVYTAEEMAQADNPRTIDVTPPAAEPKQLRAVENGNGHEVPVISKAQLDLLWVEIRRRWGQSTDEIRDYLTALGIDSTKHIPASLFEEVLRFVRGEPEPGADLDTPPADPDGYGDSLQVEG